MSRMNSLDNKRLRRIARRAGKAKTLKTFAINALARFRKKHPDGIEMMTPEGPIVVDVPTRPAALTVRVTKTDIRRQAYLKFHGFGHSSRLAALAS
jgi:hypothetical protein